MHNFTDCPWTGKKLIYTIYGYFKYNQHIPYDSWINYVWRNYYSQIITYEAFV